MRMTKEVRSNRVAIALLLACAAASAGAQTTPSGAGRRSRDAGKEGQRHTLQWARDDSSSRQCK